MLEKGQYIKLSIATFAGATGSCIAELLGGWTNDMRALICFMIIDFIMGCLIAFVWKKSPKTESGAGGSLAMWKGLCRKGVTLLIVLVANQLDNVLGVNYIRTAVIISFIVNELVSIIENAGIMGLPMSPILTKAIDMLQSKADKKGD